MWNPVTKRRHELTSMGIRVTKETLKIQLKMSDQEDFLSLPYHQALLNDEIPLSIGGGRKGRLGKLNLTGKLIVDAVCTGNLNLLKS